jgi:RNA polymerase sigma-70 factor, ECF subfamily
MTDFGSLIAEQMPALRRYARALTRDPVAADDLVQNCLVRALAKQHLWQPGSNMRSWLFAILHNEGASELRRAAREQRRIAASRYTCVSVTDSHAGLGTLLVDLDRAIARLPAEQRQAILLIGLEGLEYDEAARLLATPAGTLRSRLSRGRTRLRRLLRDEAAPERALAA